MKNLIGTKFNHKHAAGITEFTVKRPHERSAGYYICTQSKCVEGTHTELGAIWVVSGYNIERQQNGLGHDYMR